ncbi:MAG TPA: peptidyl-prolyl cis-trans isomerase [Terriglobales bacterium]
MLRPTLLALAVACAIAYPGYGQGTASQPVPSPAANQASATAPAKATTPSVSAVPMTEPVLTLKGACPAKNGVVPKNCVSSMTRQQFEQLTAALQPADKGPVPPDIRRKFATQYAKLLTFADAARELGLENDPKVQQIFTFARNQILAEALNQHYVEKYAHPTDQQIQAYYDQNQKKYLEVMLQRIIVPMQQVTSENPKPDQEAQKAMAEKLRQRWVAGEDPSKLEKEAMDSSNVKTTPPDVNVGARRPGSLPEAHEAVFNLKAGEISPVYSDPAALYIYKVVSLRQVPLSEVKTQIAQTVQRENFSQKLEALQKAVTPELNDAYFGPDTPVSSPQMIMRPGAQPRPGAAGAQPAPSAPPAGASGTATPPASDSGSAPH